jgi:hydroxymethylpyrimidine pyrophosphatase-like HAD family hydrolase
MYCRVFACDFDGTAAAHGQLAPEVAAALGRARAHGIVTLLVTGRVLEEVQALCPDMSMFDAVVAENGALIWLCGTGRVIQLGQPPPEQFLGELRARRVPFHVGAVIVGTWDSHVAEVLESMRRFALDAQLIFNREALMVLPSGVNKATGVRRALDELGRSEKNLVAFGDAENDLALFAIAEIAVAARDSIPAVAERADHRLSIPGGAGVARYINQCLDSGGMLATPQRRQIVLGSTADGAVAALPAATANVMITGDPRSGKSWLAGLVAEQLIEQGYRVCIIDPEGDYVSLGQRPRVLFFGGDLRLPDATAVPRLLRDEPVSVVLSLAGMPNLAQLKYVNSLLCELQKCAAVTGIPQWILVDEAQYFFHETAPCGPFSGTSSFIFSTYRPSLIADAVHSSVQAHLVMHTAVEEERYFVTSLLRTRGPSDLSTSDALAALGNEEVGLLLEDAAGSRWKVFTPGQRLTVHAHHASKYADTALPEDKAFRFLGSNGAPAWVAHSVSEFHRAVQSVESESLRHHLARGDFSRWASDVLGDHQLARGLRKLERVTAAGATPDRAEILAHIESQYSIPSEARLAR